jgi:lysophospholipid acyltransferase (LPLAT)-like uncharacterized protein
MNSMLASIAYQSGRAFVRYCLWASSSARVHVEGEANLPTSPAVLAGWHTANLLSLSLHYHYLYKLHAQSFMPPGIVGAAVRGEVEGSGMRAVELPNENAGNPFGALRTMLKALADGYLVVLAVDGPFGPFHRVQPGALWLARASGTSLIPMGFAARPVLRWPRWDRQIIPLPGGCMAAVIGKPMQIDRQRKIDDTLRAELGTAIDRLTHRAWDIVNGAVKKQSFSTPSWLPRRELSKK